MAYRDRQRMCILLLQKQAEQLRRTPQRRDFPDETVCQIKHVLGPWPRALEAAGLKKCRTEERTQKIREKRIRAKQRRAQERQAEQEKRSNDKSEAKDGTNHL